ncbi:MAG: hypothetical protein EON54_20030 [Alcaligenaceae bacterium]|nr:MAG: hypothetical protein EON54_20030 [Alcaligenaceae bacterium]
MSGDLHLETSLRYPEAVLQTVVLVDEALFGVIQGEPFPEICELIFGRPFVIRTPWKNGEHLLCQTRPRDGADPAVLIQKRLS